MITTTTTTTGLCVSCFRNTIISSQFPSHSLRWSQIWNTVFVDRRKVYYAAQCCYDATISNVVVIWTKLLVFFFLVNVWHTGLQFVVVVAKIYQIDVCNLLWRIYRLGLRTKAFPFLLTFFIFFFFFFFLHFFSLGKEASNTILLAIYYPSVGLLPTVDF